MSSYKGLRANEGEFYCNLIQKSVLHVTKRSQRENVFSVMIIKFIADSVMRITKLTSILI